MSYLSNEYLPKSLRIKDKVKKTRTSKFIIKLRFNKAHLVVVLSLFIFFAERGKDKSTLDAPEIFSSEDSRTPSKVSWLIWNAAARASKVCLIKNSNQL